LTTVWRSLGHARKAWWIALAVVFVAAGAVGSVLGARTVARSDAAKRRLAFHLRSSELASRLKLVLQREEDLAASAASFFAVNPQVSRSELTGWAEQAQVLRRYPELQRLSVVTLIPAQEVPAFAARITGRAVKAPTSRLAGATAATTTTATATATASGLRITPPGQRPFYCFAVAGLARHVANYPPTGVDYCRLSPSLLASRDSGQASYKLLSLGRTKAVGVDTPMYQKGPQPSTTSGRRQAFVGWLRELIAPATVLRSAFQAYPEGAVRIRHHSGASNVVLDEGAPRSGAQSATTNLSHGWSVRIFGPRADASVFASTGARAVLIGGWALSVLVGLLLFAVGFARRRPATRSRRDVPHEDLYDALTGLPNRALTLDRAERIVARAGRQSGLLAGALLVDIDWFKDVNEKLGRAAGDQLLQTVAERLKGVARSQDTVGRLGTDEFAVLVEAAGRGVRLDSLARRMIEALHRPVQLEDFGPAFHMTASIGVAFGQYTSPDDLLRDAQMALYAAKVAGKDRYTVFNANMRSVIEGRGLLESELNKALLERQLFPLYQPIYDLAAGKVVALEALIRWRHPARGVLAPDDFLQVAEDSGLIVPIGRRLLEEVCSQATTWNVAGHPVGAFVKVSANQLLRDGIVTDVRRALLQSGLQPSSLTIEVSESAVMVDVAATTERLREIKALGVRVAIDDFGNGYAFRSQLQGMPLDYLKVDRSTLAAADTEDYRQWLLEATVMFGRDLSVPVIAKGVETGEQLAALQAIGCTLAQGSLISEPLPAASIESVLQSGLTLEASPASGAEAPGPQPGSQPSFDVN
jgi:diguanylate cyclase (GGDEF)-like protein